ncbi:MAG: hypothetical protein HZB16_00490 [Armatimonadetes bacterium]|nr:hypothetical protein [Armatimonadota bacterium]
MRWPLAARGVACLPWLLAAAAQAAVTLSPPRWDVDPPLKLHEGSRRVFELRNSGSQPVEVGVAQAQPPLSAKLAQSTVPPGQTAQLTVDIAPPTQAGPFAAHVTIKAAGQPTLTLPVQGRTIEPANPLPAAVKAGESYRPRPGDQPITVQVLYNSNCAPCVEWLQAVIDPLSRHFGEWVRFERHDIRQAEGQRWLERLRAAYHTDAFATTWLFVGAHALPGPAIDTSIYPLLLEELARPTVVPPLSAPSAGRQLGLGAALAVGLVDGLNPCAFATVVFLIALLTRLGADKRALLAAGGAYIGAVFVTYTLLGVGLLHALAWVGAARVLRCGVALFALWFAGLQLRDVLRLRRGAPTRELSAHLPLRLQQTVHSLLRWSTRLDRGRWLLAVATAGSGVLVTLVEMVCTSAVYLPVLALLPTAGVRSRAMALLLTYNVGFVLPLAAVVGLTLLGVGSGRVAALARRHLAAAKLALALLLVGLAALLVLR